MAPIAAPKPAAAPPLGDGVIARFRAIVGDGGVVVDEAAKAPYLAEQRGHYASASPLVLRPATTAEVAAVVALARAEGIAIVPQGGNTGLVGGTVANGEVIVALGRMNGVRAIDPLNYTMTVDAGAVLADIQAAAAAADRLFPLSLGAEGSCQIGGNLSTNAGGTAVLRYGNARELCLGLEVVLADGRVWDGLSGLRKDNTGYDLKQLFIGAEGTLGIITGAVLKLFPLPQAHHTALVALGELDHVLELLSRARRASADTVATFELIPRLLLDIALDHVDGTIDPLAGRHGWYVLVEFEAADGTDTSLGDALEALLADALADALIADATIAQSEAQRRELWFIREAIVEGQRAAGTSIKNDVSVPVSAVPSFIDAATAAVVAVVPGARPVPFGHVGDGNIHFNVQAPDGAAGADFLAHWDAVTGAVNATVAAFGGSFSAEHGIGLLKTGELAALKDPVALDLMRALKATLDPDGLLNPGKVL